MSGFPLPPLNLNGGTAESRSDSIADGSGWTVATGGSSAAGGGCTWCTPVMIGVALVAVFVLIRSR